jgi:SAM-dependent methyltransferase
MADPAVGQLQFLNQVFADLVRALKPASLAILGCATGNGLEHIDPNVTHHIVAADINPEYLRVLSDRHSERLPGLRLVCADVSEYELAPQAFDLIHCALILEYTDPAAALTLAAAGLRPGGTLSVVVQLPSAKRGNVSRTQYSSLRPLESVLRLVDPSTVGRIVTLAGMVEREARIETLDSGKSFFVGMYEKRST